MSNILRSPYTVASRRMIANLIEAGYLKYAKRYEADAIESALAELRKVGKGVLAKINDGKDPTPAANRPNLSWS
jgi:hypothetical protein